VSDVVLAVLSPCEKRFDKKRGDTTSEVYRETGVVWGGSHGFATTTVGVA
jgi:hypothetical protein